MWKLLNLRLCAGGQGGQVHQDQCGGHHRLSRRPDDLLHHLQKVFGKDSVVTTGRQDRA